MRLRGTVAVLAALLVTGGLTPSGAQAAATPRVDLRVLVLTDGGGLTATMTTLLDQEGVPYQAVDLTAASRQQITADFLVDRTALAAKFQAVVLTSPTDTWLSDSEKTALADYERAYAVRQVDAYVYPNSVTGSSGPVYSGTLDGAAAKVTQAARNDGFSYLNGDFNIDNLDPAQGEVYGYLAQPATNLPAGDSFTPLVTATVGGNTGSVIAAYTHDAREELVITANYNSAQRWFQTVGHGIITWMTRGVHLGYHRNYFAVHIDDVLLPDSRWSISGHCTPGDDCVDPATTTTDIRMTAADVTRLTAFQDANGGFAPDLVFNAAGSAAAMLANGGRDELTEALTAPGTENRFTWINHTYTHTFLGCIQLAPSVIGQAWRCATPSDTGPYMDEDVAGVSETTVGNTRWLSQAAIESEIQRNLDWEVAYPLTHFDPTTLVTGEHSGLTVTPQQPTDNPFLAPALAARGITHVASDASRENDPRTVGSTMTVPRHPLNIFYNAGTYQDEVSEYNWIYTSREDGGSGICTDNPATSTCIDPLPAATAAQAKNSFDTYIGPLQVNIALGYMLAGDPRPFYAHQSNLAEDGILYPVMQGVLDTYRSTFDTSRSPLVHTDLRGQGEALARSAAWRTQRSGVTAYVDGSGVHVSGPSGASVPVTVPTGSTVNGVQLSAYDGELSGWIGAGADAVVAVPPTPLGGYRIPPADATVPPAPTATARPGDSSAQVSWTSAGDGGSALFRWEVRVYSGTATTPARTVEVPAGNTSVTVTGLTNGTAYSFDVLGVNAIGSGPASTRTATVVPALLPGAPTLTGVVRGNGMVQVSWQAPASNGGSPITGYTVTAYRAADGVAVSSMNVPAMVSSLTYSGLANGTAYTFDVAATNAIGTGPVSARSAVVTPMTVPGGPRIGQPVRGSGSVVVNWQAPVSDGGSPITGYTVNAYLSSNGSLVGTLTAPPTATSATYSGLTNGVAYRFTVTATNIVGTGTASRPVSVIPSAMLTVPSAPTIGVPTAGNASATVTWTAPTSDGGSPISGYRVVVYSGTGSTVVQTLSADASARSLRVTGLANGSTYSFTVAAVNVTGTGPASSRSRTVKPASLPGAPVIGTPVAGNSSATVTWTPPEPVDGVQIVSYAVSIYSGWGSTPLATRTVAAPATSYVFSGLQNGSSYSFTVAAVSASGRGPVSARSAMVVPRATVATPSTPTPTVSPAA